MRNMKRLPDGRLPEGTKVQMTIEEYETGKEFRIYAMWDGWYWQIKVPDKVKLGQADIDNIGEELERLRVGDRDPSLYEIEIPNEIN